jgi:hypothetical protein
MVSKYEKTIRKRMRRLAKDLGHPYTCVLPDYTEADPDEESVSLSHNTRIERGGDKWADPKVSGAEYYEITIGDRAVIRSGHVLYKEGSSIFTVQQYEDTQPTVCFKTDMIGRITDGPDDDDDLIFEEVRFDFLNIPTVGEGLDKKILGSMGIAVSKAIMYYRSGVQQGQWLRWDDNGTTRSKKIDLVEQRGNCKVLVLNLSDGT